MALSLGAPAGEIFSQARVPIIRADPDVEGLHWYSSYTSIALVGDRRADEILLAVGAKPTAEAQRQDVFIWRLKERPRIDSVRVIPGFRQSSFGQAIANLTDMDGDGVPEIAVGGFTNPPGETGAVWIASIEGYLPILDDSLTLRPKGLSSLAHFGKAICSLTSLDGDSVMDLVVGAPGIDSVYVIYLRQNRMAKGYQPLFFDGLSTSETAFGYSLTELGDIDGDGFPDIAVGAPKTRQTGAVYVAFLEHRAGQTVVRDWVEIGGRSGSYQLDLLPGDEFGAAVSLGPDLNRDGVHDLLVGAPGDNDGGFSRGAVWVLFLGGDGTVKGHQKLSHTTNAVNGALEDGYRFGSAVEWLGDFDNDGFDDIAVGVEGRRAIWFLYGMPFAPTESLWNVRLEPTTPEVGESVSIKGHWGTSVVDATLLFREAGAEATFAHSMTPGTRTGEAFGEIPASFVGSAGTEYAIQLRFEDGTPLRSPPDGYHSIPVRVPSGFSLQLRGAADVGSYRIVSVPLNLDRPDARAILESTFGQPDPYEWRFFGQDGSSDRLFEFGEREFKFEPGRAFLVITRNDAVIETGGGTTVPTNPATRISVNPGWNLIGNPYNFDIAVNHLRLDSGRPIDIRAFEGDWYIPSSVRALEGYALWSDDADTLEFGTSPTFETSNDASTHPDWRIELKPSAKTPRDNGADGDYDLSLYPNPFRSTLTIEYRVAADAPVYVRVFDVLGRSVREIEGGKSVVAGHYLVTWDGRTPSGLRVPPGFYHIRFRTPERQLTGNVLLVQ